MYNQTPLAPCQSLAPLDEIRGFLRPLDQHLDFNAWRIKARTLLQRLKSFYKRKRRGWNDIGGVQEAFLGADQRVESVKDDSREHGHVAVLRV